MNGKEDSSSEVLELASHWDREEEDDGYDGGDDAKNNLDWGWKRPVYAAVIQELLDERNNDKSYVLSNLTNPKLEQSYLHQIAMNGICFYWIFFMITFY